MLPTIAVPAEAVHVAASLRQDVYKVKPGDTLAGISERFCGTPGHYLNLAGANKIDNPNIIFPDQLVKIACHAAYSAALTAVGAPAPQHSTTDIVSAAPDPQPSHTQSAPSATVTGLSGTLSFSGLEALWVAAGGPASVEWDAATIAECESGGQQYAHNPSGASGYWQTLGQVVGGDVYDPTVNAENAVTKYRNAGDSFAPWVCQA